MTEASHSSDLRRIFEKLESINSEVSGLRADFRVHVAEDKAVSDTVALHVRKLDELEKLKTKGMFYLILGWIGAGGLGGGAAHLAKKLTE